MKLVARDKSEQNEAAIDPWSAVHFAAGLAAGLMGLSRRTTLASSIVYEIVEQYGERKEWGKDLFETTRPESLPNAVIDTALVMVGHWLGARWNETG